MEIKNIFKISLTFFLFFLASCSTDFESLKINRNEGEEQLILFSFFLPDVGTKALAGAKTSFENGNVIHISGKFTLTNGNEEIRYGALTYNNGNWNPVADSELTWPNTAVSGIFTAYFIPTLNVKQGSIITNNDQNISLLEEVTLTSDPLFAETPSGTSVKYGNGVNLRFGHLLTYITLENLTPAYDQFIFSTDKIKSSAEGTEINFNNAFYLQLLEDKTLKFGFCRDPKDESSYQIKCTTVKYADNPNSGKVSFFLQPGYYDKFSISYPTGTENTPFLNYQYTPLLGEENTPPMLNAGVAYTLNTTSSNGVIITSPSEEDNKPWPDDLAMKVDVDAFLSAIKDNKEYKENGYTILEKTNSGLKLNYNIDFDNYNYIWLNNGDLPFVPTGETLDGDNHTLSNLCCPLFNENNGIITNLGINNLNAQNVILNQYATFPNDETHNGIYDFSCQGGLCRINNGTITNFRLTTITMEASVITENDSDNEAHQDTENYGLIAGSNHGKIDNVRLGGNLSIYVATNSQDTNGSNCTINMGGLVGQNTDSGVINDIASLDGDNPLQKIKVMNTCTSDVGAYYIGGVVGYNAGYIGPIGIPFIDIDCSLSQCTKSFIGLLTGEITTSDKKSATIVGANISGQAKAGKIMVYDNLDSGSYVGGIAGASVLPQDGIGISVTDCMIIVNKLDNTLADAPEVINATGGCFGRIYAIFNVDAITLSLGTVNYPSSTDNEDYFSGTFAGLSSMSWTWTGSNRLAVNNSVLSNEIGGNTLH